MPRKTTKPEETVTLEETKNVQTENTPEVSAPDTALPLPPALHPGWHHENPRICRTGSLQGDSLLLWAHP